MYTPIKVDFFLFTAVTFRLPGMIVNDGKEKMTFFVNDLTCRRFLSRYKIYGVVKFTYFYTFSSGKIAKGKESTFRSLMPR